jgi:hypothetical protein
MRRVQITRLYEGAATIRMQIGDTVIGHIHPSSFDHGSWLCDVARPPCPFYQTLPMYRGTLLSALRHIRDTYRTANATD